jgi:small-conductance mechanosensitive channel
MDLLELSDSGKKSDEYYREQWHLYYSERRRILSRMFWIACGLAAVFLILFEFIDKFQFLTYFLVVPFIILILALPVQWAIFVWNIQGWDCPRCRELFFISTFVRNPFGHRCRHCGLARPEESEIDTFHLEN